MHEMITSSSSNGLANHHLCTSYEQKGSLTLLNDLIAELEFSLGSAAYSSPAIEEIQPPLIDPKAPVPSKESSKDCASKILKSIPTNDSNFTINALDIRVGLIVTVQHHESAEKLYCEEIDVGEETPRPIASGLVPYYKLEEMQNRRVLVVCNLKPRSLVGFKSNGMVLCASATDQNGNHQVEFIDPPIDAPIGARVYGESLDLIEPMSIKQCDKLKLFPQLASDLCVNESGEMVWKGKRLMTDEGKYCTAPSLRNCPVA